MTVFALPYLAAARVSGSDAGPFLQAQLSADIAGLREGAATFACHCSPRGQVFGLLMVWRARDEYLLIGSASLLPGMVQRLRLYVLRARVQLAPAAELAVCGVGDAESPAGAVGALTPPSIDLTYGLYAGGVPSEGRAERWKEMELRRNVVWLGPATTERFIPQMLGFDAIGAVSFSKGCYPGQEIIARAKYLGKVKRKPLRLLAESAPLDAGSAVRLVAGGESQEGSVVDSVAAAPTAANPAVRSLLVVVTPPLAGPVESLEFEGNSYRCATM